MAGLALGARAVVSLRSSRRAALVALVVMGLGAGLASFFLVPVVDTVLSSEKLGQQGGGRDPELGNGGPWWASLVDTAAPGIFGTPQRSEEHGPAPLHWLAEGCGGLLCLVFALGGVVAFGARTSTERFLTGLMIASFALNFDAFGLPSHLFALPGLSAISLRYTAYLGGFAVALLAARALTLWCADESPRLRAWVGIGGAVLAGVALAVASRLIVLGFWKRNGSFDSLGADVLGEAGFHWRVALVVAAGLLVCLGLRRWSLAVGSLAAALTLLPLLTGFGGYVPTVSAETAYPPIPLLDRVRQERGLFRGLFRVTGTRGVFFTNSSTPYQIADIRTHDPTEPARYVDWLVDLLSLDRRTYKKQYRRPTPAHEPFLRLLGVRYLISGPDLALRPPWIDRGLFRQSRLWELGGDTRWAFFPATVVPADSPAAARDAIRHLRDPYALASLEASRPERAAAERAGDRDEREGRSGPSGDRRRGATGGLARRLAVRPSRLAGLGRSRIARHRDRGRDTPRGPRPRRDAPSGAAVSAGHVRGGDAGFPGVPARVRGSEFQQVRAARPGERRSSSPTSSPPGRRWAWSRWRRSRWISRRRSTAASGTRARRWPTRRSRRVSPAPRWWSSEWSARRGPPPGRWTR